MPFSKEYYPVQIKKVSHVVMLFLRNVWQLVKNPTYMFITLGSAFDGMVVSGLSTFGPKYIQAQFGYSASYRYVMIFFAVYSDKG